MMGPHHKPQNTDKNLRCEQALGNMTTGFPHKQVVRVRGGNLFEHGPNPPVQFPRNVKPQKPSNDNHKNTLKNIGPSAPPEPREKNITEDDQVSRQRPNRFGNFSTA